MIRATSTEGNEIVKKLAVLAVALTAVLAGCGGAKQSATGSVHPPGWGRPAPLSQRIPLAAAAPGTVATMYDTITLSTVPHRPFALAGYVGGHWRTFVPLRRSYPSSHVISIAIGASERADCLDVEPGDASASEAPGWVRAEKRAGVAKPCLYSDWWQFTREIFSALKRAGIQLWQVWKWDADYTHNAHIDRGFDATQYESKCLGRNLDCSLVHRSFLALAHPPLRAAKPKPHPKPKPPTKKQASAKLVQLGHLLGAYDRRHNPHGHNCAKPPYRHAYPRRSYNALCAKWAKETAALQKQLHKSK